MSLKKQEKPRAEKEPEGAISKFFRGRKAGAGQEKAAAKQEKGTAAQEPGRPPAEGKQARPRVEAKVRESIISKFFSRQGEGKKEPGISGAGQKDRPDGKKKEPTDALLSGIRGEVIKANDALKHNDFKLAVKLYGSITGDYDRLVSSPDCDAKAVGALYEDIFKIYNALIKSPGAKGGDADFSQRLIAPSPDKPGTKGSQKAAPPTAGAGDAGKGGGAKTPEEQVIHTAIDQIIEIVDSRGEIPLQEVSTILNIPPERMEELAKILDEHGILQLHYPGNPLAKPVLRSLTKHDFKRLGRHSE